MYGGKPGEVRGRRNARNLTQVYVLFNEPVMESLYL
jgi:hypothetical protein